MTFKFCQIDKFDWVSDIAYIHEVMNGHQYMSKDVFQYNSICSMYQGHVPSCNKTKQLSIGREWHFPNTQDKHVVKSEVHILLDYKGPPTSFSEINKPWDQIHYHETIARAIR